jgi:3-oxoacyl-[acyl-carrier-protein] synthase-3
MRYARITGWGKYVPEKVLTNKDLEKMVDTSDEWIVTRTGIKERHIAGPGETTSTMATKAGQEALKVAKLSPKDLELIIVATSSPDYFLPPVSSQVQEMLGASKAAAFVLTAGCTGFVYGLVTAHQFIATGAYENALVIGAEFISFGIDWNDRRTCVLFGDGAGAVVLEASELPTGVIAFDLGSDGSEADALIVPGGGGKNPLSQEVLDKGMHYIRMDGRRVFKFATRVMPQTVRKVIKSSGIPWDDIELLIPHQANVRIIELAARRLRMPMEKVLVNIDRYGNTSAASIPIALCEAAETGRLKEGDHIVLVGFGGGLTWASAVVHWQPLEPLVFVVPEWPVREKLDRYVAKAKIALWNARVAVSSVLSEALTSLLLPLYTWTGRRRKKK